MQFITNNQPTDSRMSLMQILGLSQQLYPNTPQPRPEYETSEHTTSDEPSRRLTPKKHSTKPSHHVTKSESKKETKKETKSTPKKKLVTKQTSVNSKDYSKVQATANTDHMKNQVISEMRSLTKEYGGL